MFQKLELYLKDVIRGKKRGFFPALIKLFLLPISWLFRFIVTVRNWCYDEGWMRRYTPPVPLVVSIGNIVVGGTGKTPVTLLFASAFYERFPLAILSRGYKSQAEKLGRPVVICDGSGPVHSASYCGDEPYIFASRFPKAQVIVGGDRQKASFLAAKAGVQVIVLDDAMQHRRLARDFDVVVVDVKDPFGHDHFLPRGFLREDKKSLARADLIILNRISSSDQFHSFKDKMKSYSSAPVVGTNWVVEKVLDLQGCEVGALKGEKVGLFCGIAFPEQFRQTVEAEGATVVGEYFLGDHEKPKDQLLRTFAKECARDEAKWLICTEKDRVKLQETLSIALPIAWLKMELKVVEGMDEWNAFLKLAESKIK